MRDVQFALFALFSFIASPVSAAFGIPVETLEIFVFSVGIVAAVIGSLLWVKILMNKRERSVQNDDSDQSDLGLGTQQDSAGTKKDKGVGGGLEVLDMLTFAATEAAKCAADATTHAAIASKRAATAAQGAAGKSMETVAEAAASAAAEAAYSAKQSVAAARAATKAVAAAVEHHAEFSLLKAEAQAAAAVRQASESAAEAVRMAHAASASLKADSASLLRPRL